MPQTVLERVAVLGHVPGQRLGTDGKVYTRPLKYRKQKKLLIFCLIYTRTFMDLQRHSDYI